MIQNISVGSLYSYNLGCRDYWSSKNAVLDNSLFQIFLNKTKGNKINIDKNRTRDIICLKFDFSFTHSDSIKGLKEQKKEAKENKDKELVESLKAQIEELEQKSISRESIRTKYYQDGVVVEYKTLNEEGSVKEHVNIKYKMLYRTPSKAKSGQCVFINETLYDKAIEWLTMGLCKKMPLDNAKIVELSAYAPLVTSTIVDTIHIPVENILILEDRKSNFITKTIVVKSKKTGETEIQDPVTKEISVKDIFECYVDHEQEETEIFNTVWDGMGLIDEDICPDFVNGFVLLRNHFFKMAGFKAKLKNYFKDYCEAHDLDYNTATITNMFGLKIFIKDIKIITTDNAIKWIKFKELMGKTDTQAYQYWCERINKDGSIFGIVKTDHESKFGDVQQKSYQMLNTLPLPLGNEKETMDKITQYCVNLMNDMKDDNEKFLQFLDAQKNFDNNYEMLIDLCRHKEKFEYSDFFISEKTDILSEYKKRLIKGKIPNQGDNLTVCGNPYALLLYATGQEWKDDPTLKAEEGTIQCYTSRFDNDEFLCAFRNPHNSPNNILYLHNVYSDEMEKYFSFSKNIIAVNMIGTDAQDRANSMDEDSDFIYVTNQPELVQCAKTSYLEYATIVNDIDMSGITYQNTPEAYAAMDNKFAKAGRAIGESSNLAQKAMSYYWTKRDKKLLEYTCILSVLAQVAIDSVKREYKVDVTQEIKRIEKLLDVNTNGLPEFWDDIKPIKKKKKEDPEKLRKRKVKRSKAINYNLKCPMNLLYDSINRIKKADDCPVDKIAIKEFFCKMEGRIDDRQSDKIEEVVRKYDKKTKAVKAKVSESDEEKNNDYSVAKIEFDDMMEMLRKIKISEKTMNRLIDVSFGISSKNHRNAQYRRKMLNVLYHMDRNKFLSSFCAIHEMGNAETLVNKGA